MENNKQQDILISIVVPFFNIDHDLFRVCLGSILMQTYKCFEIIIIDDGSKEDSALFLDEITKKDSRIYVYHQKNKGVSEARNYATSLSTGKYLTYVDADDEVVPWFLEEALEIIEKEKADEVIGARIAVDNLNEKVERRENLIYHTFSGEDRFKYKPYLVYNLDSFDTDEVVIGRAPTVRLLKSDLAKSTKFDFKLTLGEDQIWNCDILNKSHKICLVEQIWYKYYLNPESVTHKFNPLNIEWCEAFLNRLRDYIDTENDFEYKSYVDTVHENLFCYVYSNYLSYRDKINLKERKKIIDHIYLTAPWTEIGNKRFWKLSTRKNAIKGILFRFKLLVFYWDFKKKLKEIF